MFLNIKCGLTSVGSTGVGRMAVGVGWGMVVGVRRDRALRVGLDRAVGVGWGMVVGVRRGRALRVVLDWAVGVGWGRVVGVDWCVVGGFLNILVVVVADVVVVVVVAVGL